MNPPAPTTGIAVLLLVVAIVVGACTSTKVTIDSLAKPDAANAISYRLETKNPVVKQDTLRHKEAADYVRTALSGKGMYQAPAGVSPDVVVELDYGIGPPELKRVVISEPVYRNVGGSTRVAVRGSGTNTPSVSVQDQPNKEFDGVREYEAIVPV